MSFETVTLDITSHSEGSHLVGKELVNYTDLLLAAHASKENAALDLTDNAQLGQAFIALMTLGQDTGEGSAHEQLQDAALDYCYKECAKDAKDALRSFRDIYTEPNFRNTPNALMGETPVDSISITKDSNGDYLFTAGTKDSRFSTVDPAQQDNFYHVVMTSDGEVKDIIYPGDTTLEDMLSGVDLLSNEEFQALGHSIIEDTLSIFRASINYKPEDSVNHSLSS